MNKKSQPQIFSYAAVIVTALILFNFIRTYLYGSSEIIGFVVSSVIALAIAFVVAFILTMRIKSLAEAGDKLLKGDLSISFGENSNDELGVIASGLETAASRLNKTMQNLGTILKTVEKTSKETSMDSTLQIILEGAKEITEAQYAALAVFREDRSVEKFFHLGMTEQQYTAIAHPPKGVGLLGFIHESGETLNLADMKKHPRSAGFPSGHPPMSSLLAVPLMFVNQSLGNLYVSDKKGTVKEFSSDDELAIKVFAQIAANVIRERKNADELVNSKLFLEKEVLKISKAIERIESGDFTAVVEVADLYSDMGKLGNRINEMTANLRSLILDIRDAVDATASATQEISSSADEMASGAQQQTMQTTEVASSIEQMTKTIIETSKNTSVASDIARKAGSTAKEGGKVIEETIEGMNSIAEVVSHSASTVQNLANSSSQIGEIVQVIEDIADQTNLLALNAAIEAARAGEQGRGFAVVADEVRKLAERTTKATKEITIMIKTIQNETEKAITSMSDGTSKVESGRILANKAGKALADIINSTERVSDVITQVAAAAEEQSRASDEISRSIETINSVTQETSSGVSQIATAVDDLSKLTLRLQDTLSSFVVDSHTNVKHNDKNRKALR